MATQAYLLCLAVLCSAIINPLSCYGEHTERKLLFVFGDSLFDAGNNQYLKNLSQPAPATAWPYGIGMNNQSTGRLSDGRIVPDFIAQFASMNMLPPVLKPGANFRDGANFASAGAGVLETHAEVMNLKMQLINFKKVVALMEQKVGKEEAKKILMRSVFLFSMGGNDYFSFNTQYSNSTQSQRTQYMHTVIANLTNGLKEIYAIGGRKFAFQNVGPLGCLPMIKYFYPELKGSCATNFLKHAKLHNKALPTALKRLERHLPGFKYSVFDYYHALGDRINYPTKYGFKEGKIACCGSGPYNGKNCGGGDGKVSFKLCNYPKEYVFFDGGHTTEHTNYQLAQLIWSGVPNVTGPYNVKQLFQFP